VLSTWIPTHLIANNNNSSSSDASSSWPLSSLSPSSNRNDNNNNNNTDFVTIQVQPSITSDTGFFQAFIRDASWLYFTDQVTRFVGDHVGVMLLKYAYHDVMLLMQHNNNNNNNSNY
jgi:hypothetical protein